MEKAMRCILLGPPGAGKGTQAKQIEKKAGVPLVVMGDIFRESIRKKDEIGLQVEEYVNKGALVPDELVIKVIMNRMNREDCNQGFILDGFPRTARQAEALDKALSVKKVQITHVLYYSVPDEVVCDRITGRLSCNCGMMFHVKNNPPKKAGICDACQGNLFQRKDDNPDVIRRRLEAYHAETSPLLEYYRKKNILKEVPADRPIEVILSDSLAKLGL